MVIVSLVRRLFQAGVLNTTIAVTRKYGLMGAVHPGNSAQSVLFISRIRPQSRTKPMPNVMRTGGTITRRNITPSSVNNMLGTRRVPRSGLISGARRTGIDTTPT